MSKTEPPLEDPSSEIDREEARDIIDTQVDLLRRLNDELLRTIRVHAILGGVALTGISFVGVDALRFTQPSLSYLAWVSFAAMFGILWLLRLISARLSYTDLHLGVRPGVPESTDAPESTVNFLRAIRIAFFPVNQGHFGEYFDRSTVENEMFGPDYVSCIEHNNWILKTREWYVNSVQLGLNVTFLLMVICLLGVLLN